MTGFVNHISTANQSVEISSQNSQFLKSFILRGLEKDFVQECLNSPNEILSREQQSLQLSFTLPSISPSPGLSKHHIGQFVLIDSSVTITFSIQVVQKQKDQTHHLIVCAMPVHVKLRLHTVISSPRACRKRSKRSMFQIHVIQADANIYCQ